MIIAVLSGKGGTGKTTVAVSLALVIPGSLYIDCDVEEPNGFLFLKPDIKESVNVTVLCRKSIKISAFYVATAPGFVSSMPLL